MEIEASIVRTLCLTAAETVRGLQWALDRSALSQASGRRFQLFHGTLTQDLNPDDCDLVLLTVEMGQPLPLEHLKRFEKRPGLCAFLQPTPQQLLSLSELPLWSAVAWDGVSFERLVGRLDQLTLRLQDQLRSQEFIDSCRAWLRRHHAQPGAVEWANAPAAYSGPKTFLLDPQRGVLSVGALQSTCDVRLPLSGNFEIGEFRFLNGSWSFKSFRPEPQVQVRGQIQSLRPGDRLELDGQILQLRVTPQVEELFHLGRRLEIVPPLPTAPLQDLSQGPQTVAELCKEMLYSGALGELRLGSKLKHGTLVFSEGMIDHAVTGSVSGRKALLRMLAWENPTFRFQPHSPSYEQPTTAPMRLSLSEFIRLHQQWKSAWSKVRAFVPPPQVKLKAQPEAFQKRPAWTQRECQVLASICEYRLVRDILNHCPLTDVEIVETLVQLRREGLIEPLTKEV